MKKFVIVTLWLFSSIAFAGNESNCSLILSIIQNGDLVSFPTRTGAVSGIYHGSDEGRIKVGNSSFFEAAIVGTDITIVKPGDLVFASLVDLGLVQVISEMGVYQGPDPGNNGRSLNFTRFSVWDSAIVKMNVIRKGQVVSIAYRDPENVEKILKLTGVVGETVNKSTNFGKILIAHYLVTDVEILIK